MASDLEGFNFIQSTLHGAENIASSHGQPRAGTSMPESAEGKTFLLQRAIETDPRFGIFGSESSHELQSRFVGFTALSETLLP